MADHVVQEGIPQMLVLSLDTLPEDAHAERDLTFGEPNGLWVLSGRRIVLNVISHESLMEFAPREVAPLIGVYSQRPAHELCYPLNKALSYVSSCSGYCMSE